jgi:outer membrane protein assembly factor BamB
MLGADLRPLTLLAIGVIAATAHARGLDRVHSQVDLATGKVTTIPAPALPGAQLTIATATNALVASYDRTGKVFVRTAHGHDKLSLSIGKHPTEWMPWSIVQPTVLVFAWREVSADLPLGRRDIIRGIDLDTGAEMWRRETHGGPGVGIGDHLFVVDPGTGLELVDSRSGKVLRPFAIAGPTPGAIPIDGGDTLINVGSVLARVDTTGRIAWRIDQLMAVSSITSIAEPSTRFTFVVGPQSGPLAATGAWIVLAPSRMARIDAVTGKLVWSRPSTGAIPLIEGKRIFTAEVSGDIEHGATVKLVVRDVATGRTIRELEVARYRQFFDQASARVVASRGDIVEVTSEFIVLD